MFLTKQVRGSHLRKARGTLTMGHPLPPTHPTIAYSKHSSLDLGFPHEGRNTILLQPSTISTRSQNTAEENKTAIISEYTFSDWHTQPRFPS